MSPKCAATVPLSLLLCSLLALVSVVPLRALAIAVPSPADSACAQLAGSDEERLLLCQLYESSTLLAQLGSLVNEGVERLAATQGMARGADAADAAGRDKRKHEYLRFGKRKHEFVRFGRK